MAGSPCMRQFGAVTSGPGCFPRQIVHRRMARMLLTSNQQVERFGWLQDGP